METHLKYIGMASPSFGYNPTASTGFNYKPTTPSFANTSIPNAPSIETNASNKDAGFNKFTNKVGQLLNLGLQAGITAGTIYQLFSGKSSAEVNEAGRTIISNPQTGATTTLNDEVMRLRAEMAQSGGNADQMMQMMLMQMMQNNNIPKDNTMLYIGIGGGALLLILMMVMMTSNKK